MFETERSMRTARARVGGLGSAKGGTEHFWQQRVTSVALVFLSAFLVLFVVALVGRPHTTVVAVIGNPVVAALLVLTLFTTAHHMKLGMQVIIEDYVHHEMIKFALLMLNTFFSWFMGAVGIVAVLKIAFGV